MDYAVDEGVLVLHGYVDVRCTAELRELLYALVDRVEAGGGADAVVDLSDVESIDMTALKLMAVASRVARRRGVRVLLRGASTGVRRLLHLTHLRAVLTLEPAARV